MQTIALHTAANIPKATAPVLCAVMTSVIEPVVLLIVYVVFVVAVTHSTALWSRNTFAISGCLYSSAMVKGVLPLSSFAFMLAPW